jgi:hypothetical protein
MYFPKDVFATECNSRTYSRIIRTPHGIKHEQYTITYGSSFEEHGDDVHPGKSCQEANC